jgi:hypothetical protein
VLQNYGAYLIAQQRYDAQQNAYNQQLRNLEYANYVRDTARIQADYNAAQQQIQSQLQAANWQARQYNQVQQQLTNINRRIDQPIRSNW